jgi:hypothetical protein
MGAGDQLEVVQDGSRWLHGPPSAEQLAEWFKLQPLHDGMEHDRYVSGIIVLPQTEEIEVTKAKQNGDTYTTKVERATYVPYVNISTRVRYFHGAVQEGPVVQQAPLTPEAAAPVALGGSGAEEVVEQTQEQQDEALRARAMDLQREMSRDHPAQWETYRRWWTEDRQFPPLAELSGPALRGAVTKLERDLDAAKQG